MPYRTRILLGLALLGILVLSLPDRIARAGTPFATENGGEGLDHEGERIQALRIPVYFTLRSWRERPFGLRLRLAGTFATNDLYNVLEEGFDVVKMNAFMAGLEFVVPVWDHHLLLPHADLGVGTESSSDHDVFLASIGLRSEFVFAGEHFFAGLEPRFQLDNRSGSDLESRPVFNPNITVSGRRVLGFTVAGHEPDAGVFFEAGYDFSALELTTVRSLRDAVNTNLEIGVGFGFSRTQPKIGPFRVPRVRVGYRFGDVEGWRFRIGGDWLNPVVLKDPG